MLVHVDPDLDSDHLAARFAFIPGADRSMVEEAVAWVERAASLYRGCDLPWAKTYRIHLGSTYIHKPIGQEIRKAAAAKYPTRQARMKLLDLDFDRELGSADRRTIQELAVASMISIDEALLRAAGGIEAAGALFTIAALRQLVEATASTRRVLKQVGEPQHS